LFRKKKELQRLLTDIEEDSRRLDQVKAQSDRIERQKEHLVHAKGQVEEELLTQQVQLTELDDRISKVTAKHRTKSSEQKGVDISVFDTGTLEEKAVKAEVYKDCVQNVLYTLGQLSGEFPEVADVLSTKLTEVDLRIPMKPPSRQTNAPSGTSLSKTNPAHLTALQTASMSSTEQSQNSIGRQRGNIAVQPRNVELDI
jgi:hypothetical protein